LKSERASGKKTMSMTSNACAVIIISADISELKSDQKHARSAQKKEPIIFEYAFITKQ